MPLIFTPNRQRAGSSVDAVSNLTRNARFFIAQSVSFLEARKYSDFILTKNVLSRLPTRTSMQPPTPKYRLLARFVLSTANITVASLEGISCQ